MIPLQIRMARGCLQCCRASANYPLSTSFPPDSIYWAESRNWHAGRVQQGPSLERQLGKLAHGAANLFPLWLVIGATSAMVHPPSLAWFKREYITKGLALTMLAMGTTLSPQAGSSCFSASLLQYSASVACPGLWNLDHGLSRVMPGLRNSSAQDFVEVIKRPQLVALGATLQYTLMPLMGFLVTRLFQLPVAYSVG